MGLASTVGVILGAITLVVGLALILLPLDFQQASPSVLQTFNYSNNAAILKIDVPTAPFSLGGASLTVQFSTSYNTKVTAFLYPYQVGYSVWRGTASGATPLAEIGIPAAYGNLSPSSSQTPGTSLALVVFESSGENASVTVTWTGSMFLPYAELGIPLTTTGAIILVATVGLSRPRPTQDDVSSAYESSPEAYIFASTSPMVVEPTPASVAPASTPVAALPPASEPEYASPPLRPPVPPSSATQPPIHLSADEPPPTGRRWLPKPLGRLGGDRASVAPQKELAHGRPLISGGGEHAATAAAPSAPSDPSAAGPEKCPRCQLEIGDESWAFCPRCRTELD